MLTIVTGPPCAGKSTYIRQHAHPGDIRIDFDVLAQALGSAVDHGHDQHIWKVTADARDAAITAAIGCHLKGARVWVVDSIPPQGRRRHYRAQGGRMVDLTATPAELHRRADTTPSPAWRHHKIDQWLATHSEQQPRPRTVW